MKTMREGSALHPGYVAGVAKDMDDTPPPSKQPVSTAGIFKQRPKITKKLVTPAILRQSRMKKRVRAKPGSSSRPSKLAKRSSRKQQDLHPLAAAFNGKAYISFL